jgi:hypothetical protein
MVRTAGMESRFASPKLGPFSRRAMHRGDLVGASVVQEQIAELFGEAQVHCLIWERLE